MNCLYMLAINPLWVMSVANIFSQSIDWLLFIYFFYGFLCSAKAFKLNYIPFAYFCFYFHFRKWIKNIVTIYVWILPMFSSMNFMASGLTFMSLILLSWFLFCFYGIRKWSNPILLHVAVRFWRRDCLFLYYMLLFPLSQINWPLVHGFISGLSILFHWSMCLLWASTRLFYSIVYSLRGWYLHLCSFLSRLL